MKMAYTARSGSPNRSCGARALIAAGGILACSFAVCGAGADGGCPVAANVRGHENIEWQRAYSYNLTDKDKDLPRVLFIGDSIVNGYVGDARQMLSGRMNVSFWISSYCVTSPNYLGFLSLYLGESKYDVVHFNNGLHSLGTDVGEWARALESALRLIREKQPNAKLVWASSTPINEARARDPNQKTAKVAALNAAGAQVVSRLGGIETDDLFALAEPLDRVENWADVFHFRKDASRALARQAADSVLCAAGLTDGKAVGK